MTIQEHSDHNQLELRLQSFFFFSVALFCQRPIVSYLVSECALKPTSNLSNRNQLFRTHHPRGPGAKAPGSAPSILGVRATEVGRSSPPTPVTGPRCLNTSLHRPRPCSCPLFPRSTSGMRLLPNARVREEGGGSVDCALRLEAADT